jgi:hydrogenase nickel incorporation protein HypB
MCATCGCGDDDAVTITDPARATSRQHDHGDRHHHGHGHGPSQHQHEPESHTVSLEQKVLQRNDQLAERNRGWLSAKRIVAVNLMSSPGSGKTTVLERTAAELRARLPISVIEGDQETVVDAERIGAAGCRAIQINTGTGCHLDADMLGRALRELAAPEESLVFIENVGNLVCPALFDLGETKRVVIMSVTEGEDKPLKYPHMFRGADLVLLNKTDLLPYLDFDVERCVRYLRQVNPDCAVLHVAATKGDGMPAWYHWLSALVSTPDQVDA